MAIIEKTSAAGKASISPEKIIEGGQMLKQTDDRKQQNLSRIKLQQMEEKVKVRAQNQKKSAPNARLKK